MKHSRFGALVAFPLLCAAILVPASAVAQTAQCDAARMDSAPATEWMTENAWRYGSPNEAATGYQRLLKGQSPWPDWFHPEVSVLILVAPADRMNFLTFIDQRPIIQEQAPR